MKNYAAMTPSQRLAEFASELERKPGQTPKISPKYVSLLAADIRAVLSGRAALEQG